MTAAEITAGRLTTEEGFRAQIYTDTEGHRTIGYGCDLDVGWSEALARCVLNCQLQDTLSELEGYPWYEACDAVRQSVLLDLAFNLGVHGLFAFSHMITAIITQDWQAAHDELLNSLAARELPGRYQPLAQLLLSG